MSEPRYVVDRETLIAAYDYQSWSSPDQMADMLLDGLRKEEATRADIDVDLEAMRSMSEKATHGPWKRTGSDANPHWYVSAPDCLVHGPRMDATDMAPSTYARWKADAALIAAAVNYVRRRLGDLP